MRKRKTWWWLWLCPPLLACAEYFGRRAHATAQDRMLQFLKLLQDTHSAEAGAQFYKWKFLTALLPSLGLTLLTAFVLVLAVLTLGERLRWRQSVLLAAAAGLCLSCATALYVVPQQGWGSIPREILPWFVRSAVILSCAALLALAFKHLPVYHGRFKKMAVMIGAAVLIAVLAALTVYDHNHRIIEWIARDGAGWLSRLLHRYLAAEYFKAQFQYTFFLNLIVAWGACVLVSFILSGMLAVRRIRFRHAALFFGAMWLPLYLILTILPPTYTIEMQVPVPYAFSQAYLGYIAGFFPHPLFKDVILLGFPSVIVQGVWVGLTGMGLLITGRLSGKLPAQRKKETE